MKRCLFLYFTIGICLTGCNQDEKSNESEITPIPTSTTTIGAEQLSIQEMPFTVEENSDKGYQFKKEVVSSEEIVTTVEILENANWEGRRGMMDSPPDYQFKLDTFNFAIWGTPFRDRLEIIVQGESKYIKLPSEESEILYEIITGEQLK